MWFAKFVGGNWTKKPSELHESLSEDAKHLLEQCFEGIDDNGVYDYHTHLVGIGEGNPNSGCYCHSDTRSFFHPIRNTKLKIFATASGVTDLGKFDMQYIERLVDLIRACKPYKWGKHYLLAFDQCYDKNGDVQKHKTGLYVPNDYMFEVVEKYPDCFEPCCSVHLFRKDALEELERCAKRGAKIIKWLPNSMGFDPSDPMLDTYYDKVKELKMVILSHTGQEHAIDPPGYNDEFGNPLLLRRALDKGVVVIAAHCASEGSSRDIETPNRPLTSNFRLFMRLFEEEKYRNNLFADISALIAFKRLGEPLTTLLEREDLHSRLLNGSDYPVPAINVVVQTKALVNHGYITQKKRKLLNEIYHYNPLLFDFAVKRVIKSPKNKKKFSPSVFCLNPHLRYLTENNNTNRNQ